MALLKGTCHSVLVGGNLLNSNTIAVRLPHEDLKSNLWQFSFNEISMTFNKSANFMCGLSTNYVTDLKFNESNQIVSCCPILCQVSLMGTANQRKLTRFERTWFYVSCPDSELKITFHPLLNAKATNQKITVDCEIYITVLLQRVQ